MGTRNGSKVKGSSTDVQGSSSDSDTEEGQQQQPKQPMRSQSAKMMPQPVAPRPDNDCRHYIRWVAWLQLVIGVIFLLGLVYYVCEDIRIFLLFILPLGILVLQLCIDVYLLIATKISIVPTEAVKKATLWRIYNIVILILTIISCFGFMILAFFADSKSSYQAILIFCGIFFTYYLLRTIFLYFVHSYIQELRKVGVEGPPPPMGGMGQFRI